MMTYDQYHKLTKVTSMTLPKKSYSGPTDHITSIFRLKYPDTPDDLLGAFLENLYDDDDLESGI